MKNSGCKHFLDLTDFSSQEVLSLLDLASELKADKAKGKEKQRLVGKNIALIFEKTSTRTRCAFEVACYDQGAQVTYLGAGDSQLGHKESVKDTARVLGRMYDGIEYRGFTQKTVETLAQYAGIPVFNGLTHESHPTQMLADLLTMREHSLKPLNEIAFCYVGDARNNMGHSLLLAGALMGMDVRIAAPKSLQPQESVLQRAYDLAKRSGAKVCVTEDVSEAVCGVDFIHTDVWVSMGEPEEVWQERIDMLKPYRVDLNMLKKASPHVKFMHCLPAYHNRETVVGQWVYETFGMDGVEVSESVFESEASIVFDQAENRLHTIKAVLIHCLLD